VDKVFRLSVNTPLIWRGMEDTVFLMRPCRGLKCGGKVLRVYLKINASPHKKYFVSEEFINLPRKLRTWEYFGNALKDMSSQF
jgi:hypothetical protein